MVLRRIAWLVSLIAAAGVSHAAESLSEAQVKAAFVYNFAKFTEWPASAFPTPQSPLSLCLIHGKSEYINAFAGIEGRQVQGRPLQIKRAVRLEDLKTCQLLYLGEVDEKRVSEALRSIGDAPVLTISDIDGFYGSGGMICLIPVDNGIQFEVDLDVAHHANLNFSAHLLKLAKGIKDSQAKGKRP